MKPIENVNTIEVVNLVKDYGHNRGVFDISFKINSGDCFGFLGPNGAGKSTTIRHLMGFSKPDSGKCLINNKDPLKYHDEIFSLVGYLPGEIALPQSLTGEEFFKMQAHLKNVQDLNFANNIIKKFNVVLDIKCAEMSLGMKRRLAILNCFMNDPDILILDEPTSGLDLNMQQEFVNFINEEKMRGKTILFSSHLFNEVHDTCNRIAIIKDGKIVSEFNEQVFLKSSVKTYLITFSTLHGLNGFLRNFKYINEKVVDEHNLTLKISFDVKHSNEFLKILSRYKIYDMKEIKETLEDKFLSFYNENKTFEGVWKKI